MIDGRCGQKLVEEARMERAEEGVGKARGSHGQLFPVERAVRELLRVQEGHLGWERPEHERRN